MIAREEFGERCNSGLSSWNHCLVSGRSEIIVSEVSEDRNSVAACRTRIVILQSALATQQLAL